MKTYIHILIGFLIMPGLLPSHSRSEDYYLFKSKYRLGSYYNLDINILTDEIFDNSSKMMLIDSVFLKPLNLIDTTEEDIFLKIKKLSNYNCRLVSFIECEKYDCIVTFSYTINADSGYPIIIVNTYNKAGEFLSQAKFRYVYQNDYSPVPVQYFSIDKEKNISMRLILKNYEPSDSLGGDTLKYINTDYYTENYKINYDGLISKQN